MRSFIYKMCHYVLSRLTAPSARGFPGDQRGIVAVIVALAMPVLVGSMGLAAEASYWYVHKRGMQNAADAAAIAAATNGTATYAAEAQAVAAQFGFQNGSGNITVTATNPNTATGCATNCYVVIVADNVPLFLSKVITGSTGTTALAATSVATSGHAYPYCILALNGNVATDLLSHGGPKASLNGCNIMSDSSATCTGHNLGAAVGDAHVTNNGCGIIQNSNMPVVKDPYSGLASNIPADTCGGSFPTNYPQEPTSKKGTPLPALNLWGNPISTTTLAWSGNKIVCGDQQLLGNIDISAPSNAVLVIENGQLDTNGFTLQSTSGSGLTIVFTGSNNNTSLHIPSGGGTLDIAAPTSGTWHGMVLYQDPNLSDTGTTPGNLDISAAGNSPTWDLTGMVYLPHSNVTFSGAVNKSSNGLSCFGLTVGDITINGTADILSNTQCAAAGVTLPTGGRRGQLVN
jgi:Flp pilus assembly protein TadG